MILARLTLNSSQRARSWASNSYRVHQRLCMAFPDDPRLLFRIEEGEMSATTIMVQGSTEPDWKAAFDEFHVLARDPERKSFELALKESGHYRFRLLANPVVSKWDGTPGKRGKRMGLLREVDQRAWLVDKLAKSGAGVISMDVWDKGLQRSRKSATGSGGRVQTHQAVQFEGLLEVGEAEALALAIRTGIGPAKGFGFGLLSLAKV